MEECIVCAEPLGTAYHLRCLTSCHHDNICSLCFLRMRSLQRNMNCPICKSPLDHVICIATAPSSSGDGNASGCNMIFDDYQIWGDSIGPEFVLDPKSMIFFPKEFHKDSVQPLWAHKCSTCRQTRRDMKALRAHMSSEHNLFICMLCVEHKQVFPAEQKVYSKAKYDQHLRQGDGDGSLGHPLCEFCRCRFYDSAALFLHLNKQHFECHICKRQGVQFKYYKDYADMEEHFRKDHILCEEPECLQRKFVVFANEIDFAEHNRSYHPTLQQYSRRPIPIHFKMQRNAMAEDSGGGRSSGRQTRSDAEAAEKMSADAVGDSEQHRNDRFEGGLGGRATDGEWQVEIAPFLSSTDPRQGQQRDAVNSVDDYVALSTGSAAVAPAEDFPTLAPPSMTDPHGGMRLTNRWINTQQAQSKQKKNDFPALKAPAKKSAAGVGRASVTSSSTVSSIARDYAGLSTNVTTTASNGELSSLEQAYSPPTNSTSSLGDFIRVKTAGSKGAPPRPKLGNQGAPGVGAAMSEDAYPTLAQPSLSDQRSMPPRPPGDGARDVGAQWVPVSTGSSNSNSTATAAKISVPDAGSAQQFPSLGASSSSIGGKKPAASKVKKSAAAGGGWNDAMKTVGMKTNHSSAAPQKKLTVVRPTGTGGMKQSSSSGDLVDTSKLKAIGKASETDEFAYRPTGAAKKKAPGTWVKIGGTGGEHG